RAWEPHGGTFGEPTQAPSNYRKKRRPNVAQEDQRPESIFDVGNVDIQRAPGLLNRSLESYAGLRIGLETVHEFYRLHKQDGCQHEGCQTKQASGNMSRAEFELCARPA